MKTRVLTAAIAMLSIAAFAQKREIRRAGNAIEDGEYQEAKQHLQKAEAELADADQDEKADYYYYKGQAILGTGENVPTADLMAAVDAFKKAAELGHEESDQGLRAASNALVNAAIADQNAQRYTEAAEKLITGYELNKKDTLYLYYAAANAINAKNYDKALEYYEELRDLGYTGKQTVYTAVNKETGEVERMASKQQRDLFVKSGNYIQPSKEVAKSKKGEIAKNIALIYIQKGENEKAIKAIEEAKKENPGDVALLQAEADMYYQMGNMEKYREIMEKVAEQNPNNATLFYNLGVSSAQLGETDRAIDYYKRAIELDPSMHNARINLAYVILSQEKPIIKEMNSLGMSKEDTKKYDELAAKRKELYVQALPHLEVVLEKDPNNLEAARTMMNIYYQLNQPKKAEEMQALINKIESGSAEQQ